jgi:hypothetical protein
MGTHLSITSIWYHDTVILVDSPRFHEDKYHTLKCDLRASFCQRNGCGNLKFGTRCPSYNYSRSKNGHFIRNNDERKAALAMPKVSAKALAAHRSQAIKRGEALPEENDDLDPSVLSDPTYWPETEDSESDVQHDEGTPPGN